MIGFPPDSAAAAFRAAAALWRQATALQDSVQSPHRSLVDSVVVHSPLPDPIVPIIQWIFQKPGWLMLGGIILGTIVAATLAIVLWRRRRAIGHWLVTGQLGVMRRLG